MTLNASKCEFGVSQIRFLGHVITSTGVHANPEAVHFKTPTSVNDVRSFLGMANQLGKFSQKLSELSQPMRDLLCSNTEWYWGDAQERAFRDVKNELSKSVELAVYDPEKETVIQSDASRHGIGATLSQIQIDDTLRMVCAASRSLTETQQRYATIEQEALAIVWACEKFRNYIVGLHVRIQTDHKPLVPLFNDISLDKLPVRIQRFRLRMMRYCYTVEYITGKDNVVADALSRSTASPTKVDELFVEEVESYAEQSINFCASPKRLVEMRRLQAHDEVLAQVLKYVRTSWPPYISSADSLLRPFWESRGQLTIVDDVLVYENRIVIPQSERLDVLQRLHEGHLAITKCRERAKQLVWWPGMTQRIAEMVRNCNTCRTQANDVAEPLLPTAFPTRPWEHVGSDLFYCKKRWYLLLVDYYSRFIEVSLLAELSTHEVIEHMKSHFARHGIPEILTSDNGPQYASDEFRKFSEGKYYFQHVTSSPRYPQSNGAAERAVQTIKSIMKKADDPYLGLLAYRTSPLGNGVSPAELLMGRKLRSTVPAHPKVLQPELPNAVQVRHKEASSRASSKLNFDRKHRAKELHPLSVGDDVWITDLKRPAKVVDTNPGTPRSYVVDSDGSSVRRNRRTLRELSQPSIDPPVVQSEELTNVKVSRYGRHIKPVQMLDL